MERSVARHDGEIKREHGSALPTEGVGMIYEVGVRGRNGGGSEDGPYFSCGD